MTRSLPALPILALLLSAAGCANTTPPQNTTAPISVPHYAAAFDAAKSILRDQGFILERVDAAAGVITTQPKNTAGIATPWHREQQSVAQEFEDVAQRHQRIVRITFAPKAGAEGAAANLSADSEAEFRIQVVIQRLNSPGHKLEPEAMRQHSYYTDPALVERGMQPTYAVAWKQDDLLAARLTTEIERRASDTPRSQ